MIVDKQIFELPVITLPILQSGLQIGFVAQVENYDLDFQVPLEIMAQYLGQNTGSTKYTGSTNPDNAVGNNGDVYVQTNGKTYIKSSGAWVLVTSPAPDTGAKKISLPSSNYSDSPVVADSERVTATIGTSLRPIVGAYEVNARLIVNGSQFDVPPSYTYGVGGVVTSIYFEVGGFSGSTVKVNFEA